MGAWGMGVFDDDTSCDIIDDAIEDNATLETLINKALSSLESDYIEYTECHEIIIAAAMTDAVLNGTKYKDVDDLGIWLSKQKKDGLDKYKQKLVLALERVLGESSELNELWEENEEDYPTWKANIEAITNALNM